MILNSMKINFRKFKDQKINFGNKLTVISGLNGTMKTTILGLIGQAFDVTKDSEHTIFPKELFTDIYGEVPDSPFSKNMKFSIPEFDDIGTPECIFKFSNENIGEDGKFGYKTYWRSRKDNTWRVWNNKSKNDRGFIKNIPVYYFQLDRLFPIGKSKKEKEIKVPSLTDKEKELFSDIYYEIFREVTDEITDYNPVDVDGIKILPGIKFNNRGHDTVSSGEDNISQIIYSIISFIRFRNNIQEYCKTNTLTEDQYPGGVLLIDELDASLHPPAQRKIVDVLMKYTKKSKAKIQVIFTTHSLHLLEHVYKWQQKTNKHSSTNNEIVINYIQPYDDEIEVVHNPHINSIINRISLTPDDYKMKVLVEDQEAKELLELFLNRSIMNKINIIPLKIGCSEILNLMENKSLDDVKNSIIILDGDVKTGNTSNLFSKLSNQNQNLIALPSKYPPEVYIMNFLDNLSARHPFWGDFNTLYNKTYHKEHVILPKKRHSENSRDDNKIWWKENWNKWDKENLSLAISEHKKAERLLFLTNLEKAYNSIAEQLLIQEISIDKKEYNKDFFTMRSPSSVNNSEEEISLEDYLKKLPKSANNLNFESIMKIMNYFVSDENILDYNSHKRKINNHFKDKYSKNFIYKFYRVYFNN